MWKASDEALVAGLATGDRDVALAFVRRFQARVYGLVLSITHDRLTAEEVTQDTFVRAWRYAGSYDPRRGSVVAWLLRIARNAAFDRMQVDGRRQDRVRLDAGELLDQLVGEVDVVTTRHDLDGVAGAVRSLPPDQRDTLMAAAYYGFTAREISDAWGVPLGTVKTRLRLALHKLRELGAGAST